MIIRQDEESTTYMIVAFRIETPGLHGPIQLIDDSPKRNAERERYLRMIRETPAPLFPIKPVDRRQPTLWFEPRGQRHPASAPEGGNDSAPATPQTPVVNGTALAPFKPLPPSPEFLEMIAFLEGLGDRERQRYQNLADRPWSQSPALEPKHREPLPVAAQLKPKDSDSHNKG